MKISKTWAAIFTSPSSTERIEDNENDAPDSSRPAKKRKGTNKKVTKSNVASLCRLDGQVTPRTIAYAAVMVRSYGAIVLTLPDWIW